MFHQHLSQRWKYSTFNYKLYFNGKLLLNLPMQNSLIVGIIFTSIKIDGWSFGNINPFFIVLAILMLQKFFHFVKLQKFGQCC